MGRITSLMLLGIFVALSSVHRAQVSANFILGDGTGVTDKVPRGAFKTLENEYKYRGAMQKPLSEAKVLEKEGCVTIFLPGLPDKAAYTRFKRLWNNEPSIDGMDITAKEFLEFMFAASYLDIQGEYAKRFAQNMAKYGLLGAHSADIVSSEDLSNYDLPQDTFRDILYAFLDQINFAYRPTHPSTGQTMLSIESTSAQLKQIDEEYKGPSQTAKMRTVLHSRLGSAESPERERNEAVLAWLLLNMGGSSMDIQYTTDISSSEDITNLTQVIEQFTKENEKGARVYVEGLTLKIENDSFILHSALQLVPGLSRLEFANISGTPSREAPSSLISDISLCTSLKALTITDYILESAEVSILADSLPSIEQLSIWCKPLEGTAKDSLKKCTCLERLKIDGWYHSSTTVQALVMHLPLLRELNINCQSLEPAAAEAFQTRTQLEKLEIWGVSQPSAVVQAIATHLPLLKELSIKCQSLEPAAAEAFQACAQLEKLIMYGETQPSATVQALLTHLPSLRELSIGCNVLEPAAAEAFQACTKLEILKINGCGFSYQPSAVLQTILIHLPSLKHLRIGISSADFALADALRNSPSLRSLWLKVENYTPGFLAHYLQNPLPRLKSLTLRNRDRNHKYSEEDDKAVKDAQKTGMSICAF
ncbi:hypothetical protein NECID01_1954 [Nematocida sp. AWRm77]|nr:hypothetical protein NECID01_1954 [Nematocida sp. AWRm77]